MLNFNKYVKISLNSIIYFIVNYIHSSSKNTIYYYNIFCTKATSNINFFLFYGENISAAF